MREQQAQDTFNSVMDLYYKGFKQVEIAKELSLSKGRVSQIINANKKV